MNPNYEFPVSIEGCSIIHSKDIVRFDGTVNTIILFKHNLPIFYIIYNGYKAFIFDSWQRFCQALANITHNEYDYSYRADSFDDLINTISKLTKE